MQDFVLVNGYAPHHLESHHSFHRSGACLTHVKVGDYLHIQGPIAEGKGGKSGPTSADGRYMYFGVLNSQGKTCKAAVLGVGESSSLSPPEETTREKPTAQAADFLHSPRPAVGRCGSVRRRSVSTHPFV